MPTCLAREVSHCLWGSTAIATGRCGATEADWYMMYSDDCVRCYRQICQGSNDEQCKVCLSCVAEESRFVVPSA